MCYIMLSITIAVPRGSRQRFCHLIRQGHSSEAGRSGLDRQSRGSRFQISTPIYQLKPKVNVCPEDVLSCGSIGGMEVGEIRAGHPTEDVVPRDAIWSFEGKTPQGGHKTADIPLF